MLNLSWRGSIGREWFELECMFFRTRITHPAEGDLSGKTAREAVLKQIIVCLGKDGNNPHVEMMWEGEEITERFNLLGVTVD